MDEDELDPRIQVELEKLNSATDEINKLEIELDEANTTFRMLLNECTRRLKVHSSKYGGAIESARPYYEALDIARRAQQECQQAAVSFQRANEVHEAAKETVTLAESRFMSQQPEWRFDSAWQEMLNHATIKVRDAEKQRAESSAYHSQTTAVYKGAQEKVHMLEQRLRRNVAKSRPYFEEKQRCNEQLAAQKEAVQTLAAKVARVKSEYAESLRQLEGISEEIHRKRGNMPLDGCGIREPGVGAELEYKEELEYCARETAFNKSSFNDDDKGACGLPDVSHGTRTAITDYSEIDLSHPNEVFPEVTADDDIWLDVDVRRDGSGSQSSDVLSEPSSSSRDNEQPTRGKDGDNHRDTPREVTSDNQISCEVGNKLSFDNLHGKHFNPMKSNCTEKTGDDDVNKVAASLCSDVHTGNGVHGGTVTAKSSIVAQVRDDLEEDELEVVESRESLQVDEVIKVENVDDCVQEGDGKKRSEKSNVSPSIIDSAPGQENGAKRYINGYVSTEVEGGIRGTDLCDLETQVSTENSIKKKATSMKLNRPNNVDELSANEGLDIAEASCSLSNTAGKGESSSHGGSQDICGQGDAGLVCSNLLVEDDGITSVDSDLKEKSTGSTKSEVMNENSKQALQSSSTFHAGSRPADLELTWTPDKMPQVTDEGTTRQKDSGLTVHTHEDYSHNKIPVANFANQEHEKPQ